MVVVVCVYYLRTERRVKMTSDKERQAPPFPSYRNRQVCISKQEYLFKSVLFDVIIKYVLFLCTGN